MHSEPAKIVAIGNRPWSYNIVVTPLLLWDKSRLSLHRRTADVFNSEHGVELGTKNHLVGFTGVIDLALTESRMFGSEVGTA